MSRGMATLLRPLIVAIALIPLACAAERGAPTGPSPAEPAPPVAPSAPVTPPPTDPPAPADEAVRIVTSCTLPTVPATSAFDLLENESYGADGLQTFDIAKPKGAGPFPLVVVIHGGGWKGGDKSGLRAPMLKLTSLGYARGAAPLAAI
jgi:acetyl esterase/lipase